jgi:type IV fimbrial biogenesis protein FimT
MKNFLNSLNLHKLSANSHALDRARGFTLIELIVTVAILAVLVGFASLGMQSLVSNYRVTNLTNAFSSALSYTRSEALNRNGCVTMCITADPTAPNPSCTNGSSDWNHGWIIFSNPQCLNNTAALNATQELIQIFEGSNSGIDGTSSSPDLIGQGNTRRFTFTSRGLPTAGIETFVVTTGAPNNTPVKTICTDLAGRARTGEYDPNLCN